MSVTQKNADVRLDALFDYSKIRPLPIPLSDDEDEDEDVHIITPPQKSSSGRARTSTELEDSKAIPAVIVGNAVKAVVDDNDWLELPSTMMPQSQRVPTADPTLLRIRQQKLELEHILQASLKNIEEGAMLEARETEAASQRQAEGGKHDHDHDASDESPNKRQKILLKLQEESGECHGVRIHVDEKLDKVFSHFANNVGKRPKTDFVFRFDGQQLSPNMSAKELDLEDEDIVEVYLKGARR